MSLRTYVPSNVILIICGYQVEGWDKITITRNTPPFKQIRGIRGKNTRVRMLDTSATISLTVPQTELVNDVLAAIAEIDSKYGSGRLEINLQDVTGTSVFSTATGYLTLLTPMSFESSISSNTWEISCDRSIFSPGGSKPAASGILEGTVSKLKDFVSEGLDKIDNIVDDVVDNVVDRIN